MKVKEHKSLARPILIGMVTDKLVLGAIVERWDDEEGLFGSRWENLIGRWCVRYYRKYAKAPGRAIQTYYDSWSARNKDSETTEMVGVFMSSLSKEYEREERLATALLIDMAIEYFNEVKAIHTCEQVTAHFQIGDRAKAMKLMESFRPIEIGKEATVDLLEDEAALEAAFSPENFEDLVVYDGAAGHFFRHALTRGGFIAFEGIAKIGKSFFLMDLAWRALEQGRRVAYFELGDLGQAEVIRRFAARSVGRPVLTDKNHPMKVPESMDSGNPPEITFREENIPENMAVDEAKESFRALLKKLGHKPFKLSCHPTKTLSVRGVINWLARWEHLDSWRPDVLVCDYADIMAPIDRKIDKLDQINDTWSALRSIAIRLECLVVTGTQANRDAYGARRIEAEHTANDRRKNDHVSGKVGISQTEAEKELGLYRLGWPFRRNLDYPRGQECWCASCLSIANPICCSTF